MYSEYFPNWYAVLFTLLLFLYINYSFRSPLYKENLSIIYYQLIQYINSLYLQFLKHVFINYTGLIVYMQRYTYIRGRMDEQYSVMEGGRFGEAAIVASFQIGWWCRWQRTSGLGGVVCHERALHETTIVAIDKASEGIEINKCPRVLCPFQLD